MTKKKFENCCDFMLLSIDEDYNTENLEWISANEFNDYIETYYGKESEGVILTLYLEFTEEDEKKYPEYVKYNYRKLKMSYEDHYRLTKILEVIDKICLTWNFIDDGFSIEIGFYPDEFNLFY